MTYLQSLTDATTWRTEEGFLSIFLLLTAIWFILLAMLLLFSRPKGSHYAKPQSKIKRYERLTSRSRTLWHFGHKTRSYSLYGRDKHIPESTNEARVSAVGGNIDRYCNPASSRGSFDLYDNRAASDYLHARGFNDGRRY